MREGCAGIAAVFAGVLLLSLAQSDANAAELQAQHFDISRPTMRTDQQSDFDSLLRTLTPNVAGTQTDVVPTLTTDPLHQNRSAQKAAPQNTRDCGVHVLVDGERAGKVSWIRLDDGRDINLDGIPDGWQIGDQIIHCRGRVTNLTVPERWRAQDEALDRALTNAILSLMLRP